MTKLDKELEALKTAPRTRDWAYAVNNLDWRNTKAKWRGDSNAPFLREVKIRALVREADAILHPHTDDNAAL